MGRKDNNRKKNNLRRLRAVTETSSYTSEEPNFVLEAGPGCHIARHHHQGDDWILEWELVDPNDFESTQDIPDVAIDPDNQNTLTLCNTRDKHIVAYITVFDLKLRDKNYQLLEQGTSTDHLDVTRTCTTLIVLCPPLTFAHLCYVDPEDYDNLVDNASLQELPIESDISVYIPHPNPNDTHSQSIAFPLDCSTNSFLCTQGEHGILTHFLTGNYHAIDFDCPVGTPLLAVGNGVVVDVQDQNAAVTGIAVTNLYRWNSLMIQLDSDNKKKDESPLFIEYVHAQSSCVQKGDCVVCGQVIGYSGSAGFSPRPHLHLAAYRSSKLTAPTVRVYFRANKDGTLFLPKAGMYYNADGPVDSDRDGDGECRVEDSNDKASMPQI
jgi:hypothetical protein